MVSKRLEVKKLYWRWCNYTEGWFYIFCDTAMSQVINK